MLRPTQPSELSDGTLRFLYLATAMLTPRSPGLLVLNEPETGLHGPVLGPLALLMAEAARDAQLVVTTHSADLADRLRSEGAKVLHTRRSDDGATEVDPVAGSS